MPRRARLGRCATVLAVSSFLLAAGCAPPSPVVDKSGAAGQDVRLSFAVGSGAPPPQLAFFADRLAEMSHGRLSVTFRLDYGGYRPDAEVQVVRDIGSGVVDMGWAATRAFDTLGVGSLAAVSAPMLLSNDEAARAFLDSGVPQQLGQDVDDLGVHSLGLVWDGVALPVAVRRPLLGPKDWKGLSFGTRTSPTQELAIRALGARPVRVVGPYRDRALQLGTLDGFELTLRGLAFTKQVARAPEIASNVGLWPVIEVLMINPDSYARMSPQQRGWLERASRETSQESIARGAPTPSDLRLICRLGGHFVAATPADLQAMRQSFDAVYARLDADPDSRRTLAAITAAVGSLAGQAPKFIPPRGCPVG